MDEKELFEQFMHHNMPQEAFDPDQVLAAARKAVPDDYQPSEHFKKDMDKLLRQSRRQARIGRFVIGYHLRVICGTGEQRRDF